MASLYLIISSIIFPVLAICWLCCIACCIYRSLIKALAKQGRTTKVQVLVSDTQDAPPPTGNASAGTSRSLGESWRTATTSTAASAPLSQSLGGSGGFSGLRRGQSGGGDGGGGRGMLPAVDTELSGPAYRQMIVPKSDRTRGPSFTFGRSMTMDNLRGGGPTAPLQAPFMRLPPIDPQSGGGGALGYGLRGSESGGGQRRMPANIRSFLDNQR